MPRNRGPPKKLRSLLTFFAKNATCSIHINNKTWYLAYPGLRIRQSPGLVPRARCSRAVNNSSYVDQGCSIYSLTARICAFPFFFRASADRSQDAGQKNEPTRRPRREDFAVQEVFFRILIVLLATTIECNFTI